MELDESFPRAGPIPTRGSQQRSMEGARRLISCTICQQRKVKCDKAYPTCSNCVRHRSSCVYVPPAKSQRKKRKSPEDKLIDRLSEYEALLEAHGIPLDKSDPALSKIHDKQGIEPPDNDVRTVLATLPKNENGDDGTSLKLSGKFITDSGKQSFVENSLWNSLSEELQGPRDMLRLYQTSGKDRHPLPITAPFHSIIDGGDLVLNSPRTPSDVDVMALHPNPLLIFRLWQIFLDNVDPLVKVLHAPSTQRRLLDASAHLETVPKECGALMFAIYLSAVHSLSENECQTIMGETKGVLFRRYHSAVKKALHEANFTSTLDIQLLQAFILYLFAVRQYHEPNSFWILTGTAVRLGQRMGLHREGSLIGLSPFETEIRRRIWWRLIALDFQTAELCGAGTSIASPRYDSRKPLNVNDSDLSSDMSALPSEHEGPTEMMFCGFRNEVGLFLKNAKKDVDWIITGPHKVLADEKGNNLDELQALIERKYVKFCDPSVPLHLFTKIMAGATIMALRLIARNPRKYLQGGIEMPAKERDELFWISMHVLEYYNFSMRKDCIQRFLWNVNVQFQWHAFIVLANDLQDRAEDESARSAWSKIEELFEYNPDVIVNTNTPLHNAVSRLTLKAWSKRQSRLQRSGIQLPTPNFVATLQAQIRTQDIASQSKDRYVTSETPAALVTPSESSKGETSFTTDSLLDGNPIDWAEWDDWLQNFEFQDPSFS